MEIEITSREKIKPTSPTPDHLRVYKISLLDQIVPPSFFPAVLYFAPDPISSNNAASISLRIQLLKDSLASTLTRFYPFAGIIRDALSVDCNDEGLPVLVAKVKGRLRDFLETPDVKLINRFLPSELTWSEAAGLGANHVGKIQLNCFDCGGMAISLFLAHQITDATTLCTFLTSWAATARGSTQVVCPNFIAQSVFPQKETMREELYLSVPLPKFLRKGKFVTRRYVFDAAALSTLKSQFDDHPTRTEIVSAFIWKCFMAAAADRSSSYQKPFLLTQPVNFRRRAEPPFPDNSFGNFLWLAAAQCTNPIETDMNELVHGVKTAISRINKEFIKGLQVENGFYENFEELKKGIPEEANWFVISSWSKIGLYDIDFGWGKPVWMSSFVSGDSDSFMPNRAALMETRTGDGIEAWVILEEKYVAAFEKNQELQIYSCFNPSVMS